MIRFLKSTYYLYSMPSLRVNTLRISREELKHLLESNYGFVVQDVPWYPAGLIVSPAERNTEDKQPVTESQSELHAEPNTRVPPSLSQLLEYSQGYFYLQSLASMLPVLALDPQPGERVLDLCAAPGSKTTQIAMHMQNQGTLVANDSVFLRLKPLRHHLRRLGITCCQITSFDGRRFRSQEKFDRILLDAPCSGLGSHATHSRYSPNRLNQMAKLQKQLLIHAFDLLRPGGRLIYSTCTTREEENEHVVAHLLEKRSEAKLENLELPVPHVYTIGARVQLDESFFISRIENYSPPARFGQGR